MVTTVQKCYRLCLTYITKALAVPLMADWQNGSAIWSLKGSFFLKKGRLAEWCNKTSLSYVCVICCPRHRFSWCWSDFISYSLSTCFLFLKATHQKNRKPGSWVVTPDPSNTACSYSKSLRKKIEGSVYHSYLPLMRRGMLLLTGCPCLTTGCS